ncbi:hypothetical protein SFUMM280S_05995 [Streptomyces fumanus]
MGTEPVGVSSVVAFERPAAALARGDHARRGRTRRGSARRPAGGRSRGAVRPRRRPAAAHQEREEGDEDGEGGGAHVVASAFSACPGRSAARASRSGPSSESSGSSGSRPSWSGSSGPGRSAVSRSRSMSAVPRLRWTARTIARPMPISAAAMAMVNRVRACPECRVSSAALLSQTSKATRFEVDGVEHQLDGHQDEDRVAAGEDAVQAGAEEEGGEGGWIGEVHQRTPPSSVRGAVGRGSPVPALAGRASAGSGSAGPTSPVRALADSGSAAGRDLAGSGLGWGSGGGGLAGAGVGGCAGGGLAGQDDRADQGGEEEDGEGLEGEDPVLEEARSGDGGGAGGRAVQVDPGGAEGVDDHPDQGRRGGDGHGEGGPAVAGVGVRGAADGGPREHQAEQEEDDDGTDVDEDLHPGDELGGEQEVLDGEAAEGHHQPQGGVHQLPGGDGDERRRRR